MYFKPISISKNIKCPILGRKSTQAININILKHIDISAKLQFLPCTGVFPSAATCNYIKKNIHTVKILFKDGK